ncbi:MAG: hypothetical protein QW641_00330 [Candidatus Aenigmatarchaeota archaeon]
MGSQEFFIIIGVIVVSLLFFSIIYFNIGERARESIKNQVKAEASELTSLVYRVFNDPAKYLKYCVPVNLANITIEKGIFKYERQGFSFINALPPNISDATLSDITDFCIVKTDSMIKILGTAPTCEIDRICSIDECKENCIDCYGPANICIGDKYCNKEIGENCGKSPNDCSCNNFGSDYTCCPEDPSSNEYGCIDKTRQNKKRGEECFCSNQCEAGLECNPVAPSFTKYKKACCDPGKGWNGTDCTSIEKKLKVLFVPVNWDSDFSSFDSVAKNHFDFLIKNIPLSACPEKAEAKFLHNNCKFTMTCDCSDLLKIQQCARASGETYDYIMGLEDSNVCDSVAGFSCGFGVVFGESPYVLVTTHELGHEWGLNDEYIDACRCGFGLVNPNANCLRSRLHGDDAVPPYTRDYCSEKGTKCPSGYSITCMGNQNKLGGRDIMSFANAPGPRAFAEESWNYLLTVPIINC